jgi:outer membrane protein assembly factor BamB
MNTDKTAIALSVFIGVHRWLRFFLAVLAPALLVAADEWPQFRGNPQLTGVAAGAVPANLKLLWTYEAGDSIESSAAISEGTVYVGAQTADLAAIDLQTGKLKWKYHAQEGIAESSPAVHDGVVYIGDSSGLLHAVRAADGKGLWTFKTEGEIKSSPVVAGDRVLIGSYDGNLYCLSTRDGKLIWKYTTTNFVHATPSIDNGVIYLGGCDEVFRGVRLTDGQEVLKFPAGGYTGASPVLVAKRAYYGTFSNDVIAADLATKRIVWRYANQARSFPFYSSAAASGDRVVLGGRDKLVYCLNGKTGKPIWTFATRARVDSSPALASGRVYIGSNDGHFYVLDLADGKKLWDFEAGAPLSASPAVAEGRVVIGSQDGRLYCFGQGTP